MEDTRKITIVHPRSHFILEVRVAVKPWLSVTEAARELRLPSLRVQQAIYEGHLEGVKINESWRVTRSSVARLKQQITLSIGLFDGGLQ
jgi:excisionase family DNA binding protein